MENNKKPLTKQDLKTFWQFSNQEGLHYNSVVMALSTKHHGDDLQQCIDRSIGGYRTLAAETHIGLDTVFGKDRDPVVSGRVEALSYVVAEQFFGAT